jgi:uridine kinase
MADIVPGIPRERVQARMSDGRIFEAPPGTPLREFVNAAVGTAHPPIVAAIVNRRLRELTFPMTHDSDVTCLSSATADGVRVYRRSLEFLMLVAVDEVFPGVEVWVEHSATTAAAYYCDVRGREPFTQADLARIEARMREIVEADAPIVRELASSTEAIRLFCERGELDKASLLMHRTRETVVLYSLRGRRDYFQGYMVPSAGYLGYFALHAFPPGFMLTFPHKHAPETLPALTPYPKLFQIFEQRSALLDRLGFRSIGALNDAIVEGRLRQISLMAEAMHEASIARIASEIAAASGQIRVVLVAGPSSSGKTTFAKRLWVQLLANGIRPMPIGLDDYFVDRDHTPRDDKGEYDYECIRALDLEAFNRDLWSLMKGDLTTLRHYNFLTGRSEPGRQIKLEPDHIMIVEGIHGLNPALISALPPSNVYRIYASALTPLNLDRHNRMSSTDVRLLRRTVRDAASRGYSALDTLRRWDSVVHGEKLNIFPYQENADAIFNSSLVHELAILRPLVEPLLLQVRPDTGQFIEANRLLSFLQWVKPAPPDVVPDNSILREFVGGSILEQLSLWPTARGAG